MAMASRAGAHGWLQSVLVNTIHVEEGVQAGERCARARAIHPQHPAIIRLAREHFYPRRFLRGEHIDAERLNRPVLIELVAPIISLGRIGEDLHYQLWI